MRTKTKTVYYCDFCGHHGLVKRWIEAHEKKCFKNPNRVCPLEWCEGVDYSDIVPIIHKWEANTAQYALRPFESDKELCREILDKTNCPVCTLCFITRYDRENDKDILYEDYKSDWEEWCHDTREEHSI